MAQSACFLPSPDRIFCSFSVVSTLAFVSSIAYHHIFLHPIHAWNGWLALWNFPSPDCLKHYFFGSEAHTLRTVRDPCFLARSLSSSSIPRGKSEIGSDTMATACKESAVELNTLTVEHVLSDLEALTPGAALFSLVQGSASSSGSGCDRGLLESFEAGVDPSGRKQHVELSHMLLASHRTAERLNSERVSAVEVALVLPSERSRASKSTSGSTSPSRDIDLARKATRTDLLHAKVADLQSQVDAWSSALEQASQVVHEPGSNTSLAAAATASTADAQSTRTSGSQAAPLESQSTVQGQIDRSSNNRSTFVESISSELRQEGSTRIAIDAPEAVTSATEDFEDDDPWNDPT